MNREGKCPCLTITEGESVIQLCVKCKYYILSRRTQAYNFLTQMNRMKNIWYTHKACKLVSWHSCRPTMVHTSLLQNTTTYTASASNTCSKVYPDEFWWWLFASKSHFVLKWRCSSSWSKVHELKRLACFGTECIWHVVIGLANTSIMMTTRLWNHAAEGEIKILL